MTMLESPSRLSRILYFNIINKKEITLDTYLKYFTLVIKTKMQQYSFLCVISVLLPYCKVTWYMSFLVTYAAIGLDCQGILHDALSSSHLPLDLHEILIALMHVINSTSSLVLCSLASCMYFCLWCYGDWICGCGTPAASMFLLNKHYYSYNYYF